MKKIIDRIINLSTITKIIIISIMVLLLVLIAVFLFDHDKDNNKPVKEENLVEKIPKQLYEEKKLSDISFSDIKFEYKDKIFTYIVTATNVSEKPIDFYGVSIDLIKDGNKVGNIELYNKTTIEPGDSIILKNFSAEDYTKADSLEYNIINE